MHSVVGQHDTKEVITSVTSDTRVCIDKKVERTWHVSTIKEYKEVVAFFSSMTPSWDVCTWAERVIVFNKHFNSCHRKSALRVLYNLGTVLKSHMESDEAYNKSDSACISLASYIDFLCPRGDETKISQLKQVSVIQHIV